jgi:hypothetical protein
MHDSPSLLDEYAQEIFSDVTTEAESGRAHVQNGQWNEGVRDMM